MRRLQSGMSLVLGTILLGFELGCSPGSCPDRDPVQVQAGGDQIVCEGSTVSLSGSAGDEPDQQSLVFAWEQTSGTDVSLSGASSASASFTPASAGVYAFRLTVTTGDDCATGEDSVRITVLEPDDCGSCQSGGCCLDEHCDDDDPCTTDACTDGTCTHDAVEPACGDDDCDPCGETCSNCPADCGPCAGCGDGNCLDNEDSCNCPADCGEVECCSDADCDDGLFCNGTESCSNRTCQSGGEPCAGGDCDEAADECIHVDPCSVDEDCDDGVFCNGIETCGADGVCGAGTNPCAGTCSEDTETCSVLPPPGCASDADCDDANACTTNTCVSGACQGSAIQCPAGQTCDPATGVCAGETTVIQAYDACFATSTDTAVVLNLRASADPYVADLDFQIVTQPGSGTLTGTAPALTYTPNGGFSGTDTFTFQASDGGVSSTPATVSLFVGQQEPACTGYNQCLAGGISPAGDTDSLTFEGAAGDVITVYLDHVGNMSLRLDPPAGSGGAEWFENFSTSDRQIDGVTLPSDGQYTITVDGAGDSISEYSLCLLRQDQPQVPIGYEQCQIREIDVPGDQDRFVFPGVMGDEVVVYASHNSYLSLRLTPPAGVVGDWFQNFSINDLVLDGVILPATGDYIITVDGLLDRTGEYEVCIEELQ